VATVGEDRHGTSSDTGEMMSSEEDPLHWLEAERRSLGGSRVEFHQQLEDCNRRLVDAATVVGAAIGPVTTAFLEADAHAAEEYIARESGLRRACLELEEACYLLLARQSPVSVDLRRVVATLRSTSDVERSGNLLRHVAESLTWVHPPSMPGELRETIGQLGSRSAVIFGVAIDAWRDHDPLAAVELERLDDEVDMLQKVLLTEIYTGQQSVEESVTLALIARYYERIADHGVEMARQVAYFVTGDRVPRGDAEDDL
jgi:phosphate transport system protein